MFYSVRNKTKPKMIRKRGERKERSECVFNGHTPNSKKIKRKTSKRIKGNNHNNIETSWRQRVTSIDTRKNANLPPKTFF